MKEHGVLFSPPMMRALLAGRKTMTRRMASSSLSNIVVGDRLWSRENFRVAAAWDHRKPIDCPRTGTRWYEADEPDLEAGPVQAGRLRPSIHQPRWMARAVREIVGIRVEHLHEITAADIRAEGVELGFHLSFGEAWRALWGSLHDVDGERWEDNPQVLVISFGAEDVDVL